MRQRAIDHCFLVEMTRKSFSLIAATIVSCTTQPLAFIVAIELLDFHKSCFLRRSSLSSMTDSDCEES